MSSKSENFLTELLRNEGIEYAFFDSEKRLVDASKGLGDYLFSPSEEVLPSQKIDDLFPELIGNEKSLQDVLVGAQPELMIERIHRSGLPTQDRYVTLRVEAREGGWLLIVLDVTAEGQLEQKVTQQRNELRLEIAARQRAEESLQQVNEQLEIRVAERTIELQDAYQRLQALSRRLVEIQEAERREIARELHDEIGQALTGIKLLLGMGVRNLPEKSQSSLDEAQSLVVELMEQVRQMSLDLRPAMLDDLGLVPALLWHFGRYQKQTGVRVIFKQSEVNHRFDPNVETAAYRIIQEALTNVARYAKTDQVMVQLWVSDHALFLQIEDYGVGFDLESKLTAAATNGLSGMRERAVLLGGKLIITSSPGNGTQIAADLPVSEEL